MRSEVVLLPRALELEGDVPLVLQSSAALSQLSARAEVFRLHSASVEQSESEWLGIGSEHSKPAEGVLAISAFGVDPPEGTVHFCLTLLTTDGVNCRSLNFLPDESELDQVWVNAIRLETSRLKLVRGFGMDHGLVLELRSDELHCFSPRELVERDSLNSLPEGDGELMLRRFIDDSVNILSEMELNRIRQEEGLEPLNLLWPWGPGRRPRMPNLTTERGTSVQVESPSPRLKGLCRLVGYRHGNPWDLGAGTNLKFEKMADSLRRVPVGLAVIPTIGEFREKGQHEEAAWLGGEVLTRLVGPLFPKDGEERVRILFIATCSDGNGLAFDYRSDAIPNRHDVPFSAEALAEKSLPKIDLHKIIAEALTST